MSVMNVKRHMAIAGTLLLLSLLLVALAIQAAPSSAQSYDPRQRDGLDVLQPVTASTTSTVAQDPRQRDGFDAQQPIAGITSVVTNGAQPAASSGTSTTTWIVAGSIAAALIIVLAAWALLRRRQQPGEGASATYCARYPEDAVCGAA